MGGRAPPQTAARPELTTARAADNQHVRGDAVVVLDEPVVSDDHFAIEPMPRQGSTSISLASTKTPLPERHVGVLFAPVRDGASYRLVHVRKGGVRHVVVGGLPGALLPRAGGPAQVQTPSTFQSHKEPARPPPAKVSDPLLKGDVSDFSKVPVEEPEPTP
jgi:hypothetical protein